MSTGKEHVMEMIRALPDDLTTDQILDEILFRMQVEHGLRELDEGKGIPHDQVKQRLSRWLGK